MTDTQTTEQQTQTDNPDICYCTKSRIEFQGPELSGDYWCVQCGLKFVSGEDFEKARQYMPEHSTNVKIWEEIRANRLKWMHRTRAGVAMSESQTTEQTKLTMDPELCFCEESELTNHGPDLKLDYYCKKCSKRFAYATMVQWVIDMTFKEDKSRENYIQRALDRIRQDRQNLKHYANKTIQLPKETTICASCKHCVPRSFFKHVGQKSSYEVAYACRNDDIPKISTVTGLREIRCDRLNMDGCCPFYKEKPQ